MLGIIIFIVWYLIIGLIFAIYNWINCQDSWSQVRDRVFNDTNIPKTRGTTEWCDTVIGAFIILFWMLLFVRNLTTLVKLTIKKR